MTLSLTIKPDFTKEETKIFAIYHFNDLHLPLAVIPVFSRFAEIHKIYVNQSEVEPHHIKCFNFEDNQHLEQYQSIFDLQNEVYTQQTAREKFGDFFIDLNELTQSNNPCVALNSISFLFTVKNSPQLTYKTFNTIQSVYDPSYRAKILTIDQPGDASLYIPVPLFFMSKQLKISSQFVISNNSNGLENNDDLDEQEADQENKQEQQQIINYNAVASGIQIDQNKFINAYCLIHQYFIQVDTYYQIRQNNYNVRFNQQNRIFNYELVLHIFNNIIQFVDSEKFCLTNAQTMQQNENILYDDELIICDNVIQEDDDQNLNQEKQNKVKQNVRQTLNLMRQLINNITLVVHPYSADQNIHIFANYIILPFINIQYMTTITSDQSSELFQLLSGAISMYISQILIQHQSQQSLQSSLITKQLIQLIIDQHFLNDHVYSYQLILSQHAFMQQCNVKMPRLFTDIHHYYEKQQFDMKQIYQQFNIYDVISCQYRDEQFSKPFSGTQEDMQEMYNYDKLIVFANKLTQFDDETKYQEIFKTNINMSEPIQKTKNQNQEYSLKREYKVCYNNIFFTVDNYPMHFHQNDEQLLLRAKITAIYIKHNTHNFEQLIDQQLFRKMYKYKFLNFVEQLNPILTNNMDNGIGTNQDDFQNYRMEQTTQKGGKKEMINEQGQQIKNTVISIATTYQAINFKIYKQKAGPQRDGVTTHDKLIMDFFVQNNNSLLLDNARQNFYQLEGDTFKCNTFQELCSKDQIARAPEKLSYIDPLMKHPYMITQYLDSALFNKEKIGNNNKNLRERKLVAVNHDLQNFMQASSGDPELIKHNTTLFQLLSKHSQNEIIQFNDISELFWYQAMLRDSYNGKLPYVESKTPTNTALIFNAILVHRNEQSVDLKLHTVSQLVFIATNIGYLNKNKLQAAKFLKRLIEHDKQQLHSQNNILTQAALQGYTWLFVNIHQQCERGELFYTAENFQSYFEQIIHIILEPLCNLQLRASCIKLVCFLIQTLNMQIDLKQQNTENKQLIFVNIIQQLEKYVQIDYCECNQCQENEHIKAFQLFYQFIIKLLDKKDLVQTVLQCLEYMHLSCQNTFANNFYTSYVDLHFLNGLGHPVASPFATPETRFSASPIEDTIIMEAYPGTLVVGAKNIQQIQQQPITKQCQYCYCGGSCNCMRGIAKYPKQDLNQFIQQAALNNDQLLFSNKYDINNSQQNYTFSFNNMQKCKFKCQIHDKLIMFYTSQADFKIKKLVVAAIASMFQFQKYDNQYKDLKQMQAYSQKVTSTIQQTAVELRDQLPPIFDEEYNAYCLLGANQYQKFKYGTLPLDK